MPGERSGSRGLRSGWSGGKLWAVRPCPLTPAPSPLLPHPCCALQGQACRLQGKDDAQDFEGLLKALQVLVTRPEELTAAWAMLAAILQLGNVCFSSSEVGPRCGQRPVWTRLVCTVRAAMIPNTCGPPSRPHGCPGKQAGSLCRCENRDLGRLCQCQCHQAATLERETCTN